MNELVSIITPTFNSQDYIFDTYTTLLNQTYNNWEWLVTDDCSTDSTYKLLLELAEKDKRIKVEKNTVNSGAAVTRNNSLRRVSGQFTAFIDSDDLWRNDKLEKQLEFMGDDIDFCFTAFRIIRDDGTLLNKIVDSKQVGFLTYNDMLKKKATLGCSTVMLRNAAFNDIQMPLIRTGQDYALWLKILKTGARAYPLNEVMTYYRIVPNSISRNKIKKAKRQWYIYREIENLGMLKASYCFAHYGWRAVFRQ